MNAWLGRALIAAGIAGIVYGVYLMAGKGWAVLAGSFIVYVAGFHLTTKKAPPPADPRINFSDPTVAIDIARKQQQGMN